MLNDYAIEKTRPFIVAFDGIDGVGKSTLIDRLESWLASNRQIVTRLAFPNGKARELILSGGVRNRVEIAEMVREQVIEQVSAVREGVLLIDRYTASTYVYQYCNEPDAAKQYRLANIMTHYPKPDVHVFLYADNVRDAYQRVPDSKRNLFDADSLFEAQTRQSAYLHYYACARTEDSVDVVRLSDSFVMKASSQTIWEEITKFRW